MVEEEKQEEEFNRDDSAEITISIPSYRNKDTGKPFMKTIKVTAKRGYFLWKKAVERFIPDNKKD